MEENFILVPSFRISINGSDLSSDLFAAFESLTFEDEINLPSLFRLRFSIVDFENSSWRGIDLDLFKPGDAVDVFMGMDSSEKMMSGEITSLDVTFGEYSVIEVRGYDIMHRLRFGKQRRSFTEMKDSDIASSIVQEAGISDHSEEDTGTVLPYIFQNNQSNYEFLLGRIKRIGYEMFVIDDTFTYRKSQEGMSPELTLVYGVDIDSFSVQLTTLTQGSEVEVRGWDMKNKEEISSTVASGSETTTMKGKESGYKLSEDAFGSSAVAMVDKMIVDSTDADNIAKAGYNTMLKEFITGDGRCIGNPFIRAGKTIEIDGIGERFSGVYYVVSTVHTIDNSGYTTTFKVRRTGI